MECSSEGPIAPFDTLPPTSLSLAGAPDGLTANNPLSLSPPLAAMPDPSDLAFSPPHADAATSLDTPIHAPFVNHFQSSNVRGNGEDNATMDPAPRQTASSPNSHDANTVANILAGGYTADDLPALYAQSYPNPGDDPFSHSGDQTNFGEEEDHGPMQAYAKLSMPDGDYFVTSLKVIVGRDMEYWKRYVREKKRAVKAQQALDEYALEPSQPSQPDDAERGPSSKSSQSLVGRPAGALPSNYSEQGGAVSYPAHSDDEEYTRPSRRRRRKILKSAASSNSVAPASLHPSMLELNGIYSYAGDAGVGGDTPGFVGIHPANRDDIRLISKEHLRFEYNFDEERWQLHVLGNRAFVNNELHHRGATVFLNHEDEIIVTSVSLKFRLPENRNSPGPSRGTFADSQDLVDDELESALSTSPVGRLSHAVEFDSDEEDMGADKTPTPKVKLLLKKKAGRKDSLPEKEKPVKLSLKQKKAEEQAAADSKGGKGKKKPKAAGKGPAKTVEPQKQEPDTDMSPPAQEDGRKPSITPKEEKGTPPPSASAAAPAAPVIEPGSIFEGVAAEELPQKRKGPGRPPKNGLISKRDQSFVKRKLKEYEKRGEAPPPMDELVAIVRAENKAKESAAKAAAKGDGTGDMSVMPSIETDGQRPEGHAHTDADGKSATPNDAARKSSPKPKRIVKSPSPMKPESSYTEEEMKKPTVTYVHILDEVLRDHPTGKADLQEIYDRICKRYPYFRYRVSTAGWQSSVRHNLLQHDRFVENGRSGKGRLWTINYECAIDKEKKRRVTPPPRPASNTQQHVQTAHYGPPPNGPPNGVAYYGSYQQQPGFVHTTRPPPPPVQQMPQQQAQPAPQNHGPSPTSQATTFQLIVNRIMVYRSSYLSRFVPESEEFKKHDDLFREVTNHVSAIFHGSAGSAEEQLKSDEERKVFKDLESIVSEFQAPDQTPQSGQSAPQPAAAPAQQQAVPQPAGPGQAAIPGQAVAPVQAAVPEQAAGPGQAAVPGQSAAPANLAVTQQSMAPEQPGLAPQATSASQTVPATQAIAPTPSVESHPAPMQAAAAQEGQAQAGAEMVEDKTKREGSLPAAQNLKRSAESVEEQEQDAKRVKMTT